MNDAGSNPEFDALFDECLRDVLRGSRSIEDCVAQYPDFADELRPALQVGLLTARLKASQMSSTGVKNLEMHLRAQMAAPLAEEKVIRPARTFWLPISRSAAMFLIVFLAALGSGAGAVAASSNAMPGDWLYGLKRLWEAIILALTPLTGQEDDIYLTIAEHRLDEVEALSQRGMLTNEALLDLYDATAQAIASADAQTAVEVTLFLQEINKQVVPVPLAASTNALRDALLTVTTPIPLSDGRLQAPVITPPNLVETTAKPSATPSPTSTETPTITATASPTLSATPSNTPTQTLTPTPRVPATATRTPTPTVTPTVSVTPSITPTHTWTPLPLPTLPQSSTLQPTDRPGQNSGGSNTGGTTPDEQATIRVRETDQAVFLTQTAQPLPTENIP